MKKKVNHKDILVTTLAFAAILAIAILVANIDMFFPSPEIDLQQMADSSAKLNVENIDFGTNPDAKVTIIEYSDFECPYCSRASETMKKIKAEYGSEANLVFKHFPVHGRTAQLAAEASECARDQGKFWEYHYILFENQNDLTASNLVSYANQLGLDEETFKQCLTSGEKTAKVMTDFSEGQQNGVTGTPTFFINSIPVVGAQDYAVFKEYIDSELSKAQE